MHFLKCLWFAVYQFLTFKKEKAHGGFTEGICLHPCGPSEACFFWAVVRMFGVDFSLRYDSI